MSKIVSPYPPLLAGEDYALARGPRWRLWLRPNADGDTYIMRWDGEWDEELRGWKRDPTWVSWEFFDGHDVVIDAGLDRPRRCLLNSDKGYIEVVSGERPTPSPDWQLIRW